MTGTSIQINDMPAVLSALRDTKLPGQRADGSPVGVTIAQILQTLVASDVRGLSAAILSSPGSFGSLASAATCDIGAQAEFQLEVTGTETILSFGSVANSRKRLFFQGEVLLRHNGTSLVLPGASNITTGTGDILEFSSDAAGNWRLIGYLPASGLSVAFDQLDLAEGDLFTVDANGRIVALGVGADDDVLKSSGGAVLWAPPLSARSVAVLQYQQPSGTAGGAAAGGTVPTPYPINTETHDPDGIVSLSLNEFALSVDCWCMFWAVFYRVNNVTLRLYNVTDRVEVGLSVSGFASNGDGDSTTPFGKCLLKGGKTYRLDYIAQSRQAGNGLGQATSNGTIEIFGQVQLEQA